MLRLLSLTLLLLLVPATSGSSLPEPQWPQAASSAANLYVDLVLDAARLFIRLHGLDPLPIPDQRVSFEKRIGPITVRGSASLTEGSVSGVASIRRVGDFVVRGSGHTVTLDGSFGVRDLRGGLVGRASFQGVGVSIGVSLTVGGVDMGARISNDLTGGGHPELQSFSVSRLSGIVVNVAGLGPIGWAMGKIVSSVANSVSGLLRWALQGPLRQQLGKALQTVRFPDLRPQFAPAAL